MTLADKFLELQSRLGEVADLQHAAAVLNWDQQVYMPKAGLSARGQQLATLSTIAHERFTSPAIGELLAELADYERQFPAESTEASVIRVTRREYEKRTKLPAKLVMALAKAGSDGYGSWLKAREAKDFSIFRPALEHNVALMHEIAAALGHPDTPLDAFVDESEPGVKFSEVQALFAELRAFLVPLVAAINERADRVSDAVLVQPFDLDAQWQIGLDAVRAIGYDLDSRGRADKSVHPFTTSFSPNDVRITTRMRENEFTMSFFAMLHEAGHGSYELGLPQWLERTILCQGASGGMHESQSRLWENIVGRSREFWQFFLPTLRRYFPAQTAGATVEQIYGAVNKVMPSFVRTEADEVTYNLHVMIRTELEQAVLAGALAVADLEAAWNDKYHSYLGIVPSHPVEGVLQDIHWTGFFGGSFVSYTLGNVIASQLFAAACRDIPNLVAGFAKGEFAPLLHWMNAKVHVHGSKFTPNEVVKLATGADLTAAPYIKYISTKFGELYGL